MALEPLQFVNGLFSLILVIIYTIVGIVIVLKYKKTKERTYIFFGITWIGMVEAYMAVSTSFIIALFNEKGLLDLEGVYFIIGVTFYPVVTLIWLTGFTDILYKDKQRIIQIVFLIIGLLFEILFFIFLKAKPTLIGKLISPVDSKFGVIVLIYIYISLGMILTTGILVGIASLRSDNREHKLRGAFLIIALITFVIGAAFDTLELEIIPLTIIRLVLISSAIEFYIAFVLPKWAKRLFIKLE